MVLTCGMVISYTQHLWSPNDGPFSNEKCYPVQYLVRSKDKVVTNDQCGYLMRTKVSSSDEGGVAAGFAVLDSLYLTDKVMHNSTFSTITFP